MSNSTDPNKIYESIIADNPQVTLNNRSYWIVEGDIAMNKDSVREYAFEQADEAQQTVQGNEPTAETQGLLAISGSDGRVVRWRKGKVLTYFVNYATFNGNDAEYQQVVAAMDRACRDWEDVCAVRFQHLVEFDKGHPTGVDVPLFDVRRDNQYPNLLALAFFPDSPKEERHVWIFGAFFNEKRNPYTMEGVLRHELGHVLGFRHEHIREGAPRSCEEAYHSSKHGDTTDGTIAVTPYDHTSIMHYICPDVDLGNPKWSISSMDQQGAQAIYGSPDGTVVPPDHKMDYRD